MISVVAELIDLPSVHVSDLPVPALARQLGLLALSFAPVLPPLLNSGCINSSCLLSLQTKPALWRTPDPLHLSLMGTSHLRQKDRLQIWFLTAESLDPGREKEVTLIWLSAPGCVNFRGKHKALNREGKGGLVPRGWQAAGR